MRDESPALAVVHRRGMHHPRRPVCNSALFIGPVGPEGIEMNKIRSRVRFDPSAVEAAKAVRDGLAFVAAALSVGFLFWLLSM